MPRRAPALLLALALPALVAACTDDGGGESGAAASGSAPLVAEGIPRQADVRDRDVRDVSVRRADGSTFALGDYQGRPLVVNFYAHWCAPCREELPHLQAAWEQLGPDVAFVGIAEPTDIPRSRRMAAELGITFDLGEDPDGEALAAVQGAVMPVTVFVRPDGTVAELRNGGLDADELHDLIDEHLRP